MKQSTPVTSKHNEAKVLHILLTLKHGMKQKYSSVHLLWNTMKRKFSSVHLLWNTRFSSAIFPSSTATIACAYILFSKRERRTSTHLDWIKQQDKHDPYNWLVTTCPITVFPLTTSQRQTRHVIERFRRCHGAGSRNTPLATKLNNAVVIFVLYY
jgi:hypothetical protein